MQDDSFLKQARAQGDYDSEGVFQIDLRQMGSLINRHLHSAPGLWFVNLLRAAIKAEAKEIDLTTHRGQLDVAFEAPEFIPQQDFLTRWTSGELGHSRSLSFLMRALMAAPLEMECLWSGNELFTAETSVEQPPSKRYQYLFVLRHPSKPDFWQPLLRTASEFLPLPPIPILHNGQTCWEGIEWGGPSELLDYRKCPGEDLAVQVDGHIEPIGGLLRLGLARKPVHRLYLLEGGARVHTEPLELKSMFVCTEFFLPSNQLPTDLGGFSLRRTEALEDHLNRSRGQAMRLYRNMLSKLISRHLPYRDDDRQKEEKAMGSAVALGGLTFLQMPFSPPLITIVLAGAIMGGVGLRKILLKKRKPWRGEHGHYAVRRDLVSLRKQVDARGAC